MKHSTTAMYAATATPTSARPRALTTPGSFGARTSARCFASSAPRCASGFASREGGEGGGVGTSPSSPCQACNRGRAAVREQSKPKRRLGSMSEAGHGRLGRRIGVASKSGTVCSL
eukprot:1854057-Prymnesium_polylepis.1